MEIKELAVRFTDNATDEINALIGEMQLIPVAQYLAKDSPLPDDLRQSLKTLVATIADLFSVDLPEIERDPERALRTISRDINLSRLLRERGIFRLYRLINQLDSNGVPLFMSLINPDTGSPFARQEEFIGWFCREAHVARSLAFQRLATIDRAQTVGFTLEEAFNLIITKPYAIRETLNMAATWDKAEMKSVSPDVVLQIARKVDPEAAEEIEALAEEARDNPEAMEELKDAFKPVLAKLLQEVSLHDRSKDALAFVRYDVLLRPEINYTWDIESGTLLAELVRRNVDPKTGEEYMLPPVTVPFVPDTLDLPTEIRDDLLRRLPIRNRVDIDV